MKHIRFCFLSLLSVLVLLTLKVLSELLFPEFWA